MPTYDETCLSAEDRRALDKVFGEDNAFDFAGVK
jgi:hypothetical protein